MKRRTYVGLIDRIVFYDHDEISIEFNLQNINHDRHRFDDGNGSKVDQNEDAKRTSRVIPQSIHDNSCTRYVPDTSFKLSVGARIQVLNDSRHWPLYLAPHDLPPWVD
ncbi:MAG: hypothetical protein QGH37_20210 [Candidatus Poribacteria bacterium]|nr:hypothetical protein [Candidatus Poribacteria bacterium]